MTYPARNPLVAVSSFNFQNQPIRAIASGDGSAWLIAKDVCECLGLANITEALAGLDMDEKTDFSITDDGNDYGGLRPGKVKIISESGLYKLIFKSRKPEAKAFTKWVTSEVLPALRRTGSYSVPGPKEAPNPFLAAGHEHHSLLQGYLNLGVPLDQALLLASRIVNRAFGSNLPESFPGSPSTPITPAQLLRSEPNSVTQFVESCCFATVGARTKLSDLYDSYLAWCRVNPFRENMVLSKRKMASTLRASGFVVTPGKGNRMYVRDFVDASF